jgi:hypothetical protein
MPLAFPVITTTTATTAGGTTATTCPASVLAVAGAPEAGRSTLVPVSALRRRQPAAQKRWSASLASSWSVLPRASARWTRIPTWGTHLAEANRSAKSNPARSAGSATVHPHRTPVRCHAQTSVRCSGPDESGLGAYLGLGLASSLCGRWGVWLADDRMRSAAFSAIMIVDALV